ncbi:enoyl-CoA hydratase/isomerase family protein [Caenimonas terrae]|uniref:Enoyl-CoA hydratase/isomerase family protein n=1 Tax=Caenimonas terrae TaxID=696074 RepID=A0ABW0N832_9BURK
MSEGTVHLERAGALATVTFDRPQERNAMTWAMYGQLGVLCEQLRQDSSVRAVLFRGAGGKAFVAGTDIAQFLEFRGGDAGVAYEQRIDSCIGMLEALPMPTIALVEGWAVGGGVAIATACDFRIATPESKFGVPIARTLGNCLSMSNMARLVQALGAQRVRRMLLLAEMVTAGEALACGYLHAVADAGELQGQGVALAQQLAALAPVTQAVAKEALRRLQQHHLPDAEDLIRRAYGSKDFREGVQAFTAKRPPVWSGE